MRNSSGRAMLAALLRGVFVLVMLIVPAQAMALVVTRDMGGSVRERIAQVNRLTARGTEVRIVGTCVSACTLYLGVPNACVTPTARLGFHGPATRVKGLPLPRAEYERISLQMAALYPPALRAWFLSEARLETASYIVITGQQAISLGARRCA